MWVEPAQAVASAAQFAVALGGLDLPLIPRRYEVEKGYFQLDPCDLIEGQAEMVRTYLVSTLSDSAWDAPCINAAAALADARNGGTAAYMRWLT